MSNWVVVVVGGFRYGLFLYL